MRGWAPYRASCGLSVCRIPLAAAAKKGHARPRTAARPARSRRGPMRRRWMWRSHPCWKATQPRGACCTSRRCDLEPYGGLARRREASRGGRRCRESSRVVASRRESSRVVASHRGLSRAIAIVPTRSTSWVLWAGAWVSKLGCPIWRRFLWAVSKRCSTRARTRPATATRASRSR